jgi:hypothetical protein
MGKPASPVHWSAETAGQKPFHVLNDQLVEICKRMLATAAGLTGAPEPVWTKRLLADVLKELQQALAEVDARAG